MKVSIHSPSIHRQVADYAQGWSYTYISPDNFGLKELEAKNGLLAPEGPAWQAILVESSKNLTVDAIKHMKDLAAAGFPVIFSGGSPGFFPIHNDTKDVFEIELSDLKRSPQLYEVETGDVAKQLASIGLAPRVGTNMRISAMLLLTTTWQRRPES